MSDGHQSATNSHDAFIAANLPIANCAHDLPHYNPQLSDDDLLDDDDDDDLADDRSFNEESDGVTDDSDDSESEDGTAPDAVLDADHPICYYTSQRGKEKISCAGYRYVGHRVLHDGSKSVRCVEKDCKGRIHINNGEFTAITDHDHDPDLILIEIDHARAVMRNEAITHPLIAPIDVFNSATVNMSDAARVEINYQACRDHITSIRRRHFGTLSEPTSLADLSIPEPYQFMPSGEKFLLFDTGSAREDARILCFGTNGGVQFLKSVHLFHFLLKQNFKKNVRPLTTEQGRQRRRHFQVGAFSVLSALGLAPPRQRLVCARTLLSPSCQVGRVLPGSHFRAQEDRFSLPHQAIFC